MAQIHPDISSILDRLEAVIERTVGIRDELRQLVPLLRVLGQAADALITADSVMAAVADLLAVERTLQGQVHRYAMTGGDLRPLGNALLRLRDQTQGYRDVFNEMWRLVVPLMVTSVLQEEGDTEEAVWGRRWGDAGAVALGIARGMEELDRALLTLRYADRSLNDVARVLNIDRKCTRLNSS